MLANLINAASVRQGIRKSLLKRLDRDSIHLHEISRQFVHRATPLQIRSFVELSGR